MRLPLPDGGGGGADHAACNLPSFRGPSLARIAPAEDFALWQRFVDEDSDEIAYDGVNDTLTAPTWRNRAFPAPLVRIGASL